MRREQSSQYCSNECCVTPAAVESDAFDPLGGHQRLETAGSVPGPKTCGLCPAAGQIKLSSSKQTCACMMGLQVLEAVRHKIVSGCRWQ